MILSRGGGIVASLFTPMEQNAQNKCDGDTAGVFLIHTWVNTA